MMVNLPTTIDNRRRHQYGTNSMATMDLYLTLFTKHKPQHGETATMEGEGKGNYYQDRHKAKTKYELLTSW